jgi:ATP-binding cassette, subfamily B, multidrug efflux pump
LKHLFTIHPYFLKNKKYFFGGIVFVILSNLFGVMAPQITGHMVNKVQQYLNPSVVTNAKSYNFFVAKIVHFIDAMGNGFIATTAWFSIIIILLALLRGLFMYFMRQTLIVMSRHIEYDQKNDIFIKYQGLNQLFFKQNATGDLMNRISEDVSRVRMYTGPGVMYLFNLSSLIVLAIYFMWQQNSTLTLLVLSPLPLLAFTMYKVNSTINKRSEAMQAQLSELTSQAQEAYSGIRIIKTFGQEKNIFKKYATASDAYKTTVLKLAKVESLYFPVIALMIGISTLLAIYFGGRQVIAGTNNMQVGNIVEFVMYVTMLTFPVSAIGWVASIIQRAAASQKRINEFLLVPTKQQFTEAEKAMPTTGVIEFKDVSFTYTNTGIEALKNINLTIPYGKKIVITGHTGCGKSTLAQLLLKFYTPNNGQIEINDINVQNINTQALRNGIAFVPQDVFLFSETIAQNVAFGLAEKPSQTIIETAAKNAVIHNEILAFNEGYQTMVGERGVTLSGGQKQRISIARSLIKNAPFIVLDDCLSAVDLNTEQQIINFLQTELAEKTAIIISHRVTSYTNADAIIVLKNGTIAEQGSHKELMQKNGLYVQLYNEQMKMVNSG